MKNLYLIGGAMGTGKTSVCRVLNEKLGKSVFFDGDWAWSMNPFTVNDETKKMAIENICFVLNSFIKCSEMENVVFCWVMHMQQITDEILSKLDTEKCRIFNISLVCSEEKLKERLENDVKSGIRKEDVIERSIKYLPLYEKINSQKIDVSYITCDEAADKIINIMKAGSKNEVY